MINVSLFTRSRAACHTSPSGEVARSSSPRDDDRAGEGRAHGASTIPRWIACGLAILFPVLASACPVCFGDTSSKITTGAQNGILFLLGVIGFVQVGFVALFWSFWKRAKALRLRREQLQVIEGGIR